MLMSLHYGVLYLISEYNLKRSFIKKLITKHKINKLEREAIKRFKYKDSIDYDDIVDLGMFDKMCTTYTKLNKGLDNSDQDSIEMNKDGSRDRSYKYIRDAYMRLELTRFRAKITLEYSNDITVSISAVLQDNNKQLEVIENHKDFNTIKYMSKIDNTKVYSPEMISYNYKLFDKLKKQIIKIIREDIELIKETI